MSRTNTPIKKRTNLDKHKSKSLWDTVQELNSPTLGMRVSVLWKNPIKRYRKGKQDKKRPESPFPSPFPVSNVTAPQQKVIERKRRASETVNDEKISIPVLLPDDLQDSDEEEELEVKEMEVDEEEDWDKPTETPFHRHAPKKPFTRIGASKSEWNLASTTKKSESNHFSFMDAVLLRNRK